MNGQEIDINNFNAIKFIGKQLLITMSFIFALAWNDAFKNFFKRIPYLQKYGPWIYALSITIFRICSISSRGMISLWCILLTIFSISFSISIV